MLTLQSQIKGLTPQQVLDSRKISGYNRIEVKKENKLWATMAGLAAEPMVIILLVSALIYFLMGDTAEGIFMAFAIILVGGISIYQQSRSNMALEKLREFSQPLCKVIRDGKICEVKSQELVPGDSMVIEEGTLIPADGTIVESNDFSVNESILTGESFPVAKDYLQQDHIVFQGTTVASGLAIATVTATGDQTKLGAIGKGLQDITSAITPLEVQINNFVRKMVIAGVSVFTLIWLINYHRSKLFLDSLLNSLTIAMSILPEEIPVAFATFMAMGAWRLMKMGIVVKQMKTVETLGSATVICTDKTGTITENKMTLGKLYVPGASHISKPDAQTLSDLEKQLITIAMWASEPIPFDPMEITLHQKYGEICGVDKRADFKIVHEYPLDGKPPMMTHVFKNRTGDCIIAAKGAPEAIIAVSDLTSQQKKEIKEKINGLAADGYRVLAVAQSDFSGTDFPVHQQELPFSMKGLLAFYDPPKKNITAVFKQFEKAGIDVKIITGDNALTTSAIAKQVGFQNTDTVLTGDDLLKMDDQVLGEKVMQTQIFARMFPEAKLRVINALKKQDQIVAMTGDGVNDGPALKAAHIGVAMGNKGTEIARQAASLILVEDDLEKMVQAVAMGRKIYGNLKKAVRYIISIHIPIILTVFIPLALNWKYPNIFTVVHIIFLELIMGPTCSIIFENEPMEKDLMLQKPRPFSATFFNWQELSTSIVQGLIISAGTLAIYQFACYQGFDQAIIRTMVFVTLISANIFLTLVNRSFLYSLTVTLRYRNNLVPIMIGITVALTGLIIFTPFFTHLFDFKTLSLNQLSVCLLTGFLSVIWYEIVKYGKRKSLI